MRTDLSIKHFAFAKNLLSWRLPGTKKKRVFGRLSSLPPMPLSPPFKNAKLFLLVVSLSLINGGFQMVVRVSCRDEIPFPPGKLNVSPFYLNLPPTTNNYDTNSPNVFLRN